jgi:hypothetical protein
MSQPDKPHYFRLACFASLSQASSQLTLTDGLLAFTQKHVLILDVGVFTPLA